MRLDLAGHIKVEQRAGRGWNELRGASCVKAPVEPDDGIVLDQHVVGRRLRDAPRGKADDHDPSLEGDALDRTVVDVAADRVEHHAATSPSGEAIDLFSEDMR